MVADDAKGIAFFESRIRPVLVKHCYKCHSVETGKSNGGLLLDSREKTRAGGDTGPAVVPGKPEQSLLLTAISHTNSDLKMPPKKDRLPPAVIADVKAWISMGAPDPRKEAAGTVTAARPPVTVEEGRKFWAYQKPVAVAPPAISIPPWARNEIDAFVISKLEASNLKPSLHAAPGTFLRRLHYDLVGLPPSPEALAAFSARGRVDGVEKAIETEVDALLASPRFGERWGRHWLDVARFAESSGKEANISFPYAFRYRDYVIDAFNDDVPYDRFLTEQIAGDLLPASDDKERARLLIATGFLALGPKNLDEADPRQFVADLVDEQIDTVTRAVLANSVACARCHDHKFDPFSMQDYYALAGVFGSTRTFFGTYVTPSNRIAGDPLVLPKGAGAPIFHAGIPPQQVEKLKKQLADLKKEDADRRAAAMRASMTGGDPEKFYSITDALRIFWTSGGIEGQLEKVDENGAPLPLAMGVTDGARIADAPFMERGDVARPGKPVPRGFPRVIEIESLSKLPADRSGRLEFARWLTHPDNPLTARVMANRVWRNLFGAGLVATVDNFGFSGERPSHPELLDHLAVRFVAGGWSVKKLVREIVLSRTYRQSSTYDPAAFKADPDNRLLWRFPKRRMDAEAIRDGMLAVSGELNESRPAGSLVAKEIGDRPISLIGLDPKIPKDLDGSLHRSVYLPVLRDTLPDVLDLFDFAEPSLVTGDRQTTNVPPQALYLMNGPFVKARAAGLANRIAGEKDPASQVRSAFLLCFSREPDAEELKLGIAFIGGGTKESSKPILTAYCQALLATAEFRNVD
ncbi:PSD1 and planctomycete cytochrome C domain-containing protein [Humisphaera borealis]|uniref:PSD1 domain-containing protein n=1 Tax=Humisphaera borealis TaxID=2807512 RepID=A0A7M2WZ22_9BACT|nr:PSD1 and planctomycete cytochrome C domain-containing protein [Humisphaera borealis]QOV90725.1 PSD1 domain-containing protein [Humisphaera borealis]